MISIKELDNGIRIVMEKLDNVNSISLGVIVENDSSDEDETNNGIYHFIEHMLFRGTSTKTARDISNIIDNIGGNLNAFTSKENTCFYAQILKPHLDIVIELLSDIFLNSLFLKNDIDKEKRVIEEEIKMYLDDYEDLTHELLNKIMYSGSSLSLPILGNIETIRTFNSEKLKQFFDENYISKNIIISVAGDIDITETYKKINENFGRISDKNYFKYKTKFEIKHFDKNSIEGLNRNIEQFNLCIGLPGVPSNSDSIYSYLILSNILANNESSRLYQAIREEGHSYSIYSNITSYKNIGDMSIFMGINNEEIENVLSIIDREFHVLSKKYISDEEIERCREQLKINYILENESSLSKMFENGKSVSLFERVETKDEIIDKIDKVTKKEVNNIINKKFKREYFNVSFIGNIKDTSHIEKEIKNKLFRGE